MLWLLSLMIVGTAFAAYWSADRAAAEMAATYGRLFCQRAGVQWLDQSVHRVSLRLRRFPNGRLGWERLFRYEYSVAGEDRQAGLLTLQGTRLVSSVEPMPVTQTVH